jgi:hypothetical protein
VNVNKDYMFIQNIKEKHLLLSQGRVKPIVPVSYKSFSFAIKIIIKINKYDTLAVAI